MIPRVQVRFVILVILDGWGVARSTASNAISKAKKVNFDKYWASYPHTQLLASGESVGLPKGEAGNTEVGHLNLGAGRIVYQDLTRINMAVADGKFFDNGVLWAAIEHARINNSNLHLMGLVGSGGVHSSIDHIYALLRLAKERKFDRVFLHVFTDGRDSPPTSGLTFINHLREAIKNQGVGKIASIMGRYWAMDRDFRWERTQRAYFALTKGVGNLVKTPEEVFSISYSQGVTDEFIEPSVLTSAGGLPVAQISDNDAIIFFNFRLDRPRQLTKAFVAKDFKKESTEVEFDPYLVKRAKKHQPEIVVPKASFDRGKPLTNLYFVMMTQYAKSLVEDGAHVAFPPERVELPLGRVISENDMQQLRISESEKERFVGYYFNGQQDVVFSGEERIVIQSPRVPTYDQKPEMSARELTEALLKRIKPSSDYSFMLVNFANADMVGHSGNIGATVAACEVVDECIGKIANFVLAFDGAMIITADHGNAEQMIDEHSGKVNTEHSTNPVPFIALSKELMGTGQMLQSGILADVAPTALSLLGLEIPDSMTGKNLLEGIVR